MLNGCILEIESSIKCEIKISSARLLNQIVRAKLQVRINWLGPYATLCNLKLKSNSEQVYI